jgi:hypothetical protein
MQERLSGEDRNLTTPLQRMRKSVPLIINSFVRAADAGRLRFVMMVIDYNESGVWSVAEVLAGNVSI